MLTPHPASCLCLEQAILGTISIGGLGASRLSPLRLLPTKHEFNDQQACAEDRRKNEHAAQDVPIVPSVFFLEHHVNV
jgi:hypothetical protein